MKGTIFLYMCVYKMEILKLPALCRELIFSFAPELRTSLYMQFRERHVDQTRKLQHQLVVEREVVKKWDEIVMKTCPHSEYIRNHYVDGNYDEKICVVCDNRLYDVTGSCQKSYHVIQM
jgi:hypothetical protein